MKKWLTFPKFPWFAPSVVAITILSTLSGPVLADPSLERQVLPLPEIETESTIEQPSQQENTITPAEWIKHKITIGKNESLSTALDRLNVSAKTTYHIGQLSNSRLLTNLKAGDELVVWVDKNHELQKILYPKTDRISYELIKTDLGYYIDEKKAKVEIRTETAFGMIHNSFYIDAQRAGLSAKSIMNLADMFAWDIDFIRELRDGDVFKVIYETEYLNNKYIGDGDILAAQITSNNRSIKHNAFIFRKNKEVIGYYNEEGKALKKAFIRAPVDYVRITSKFDPHRFHPVLKKWRSHKGVDYGGPVGTPIHTTGNGKIVYQGWGNGYGKYVKVQHAGQYQTLYAHLSKFGSFKKGSYVKQGDTIGYLGSTGMVTGPHLHYEFLINGKHVDPLGMKFPEAGPIDSLYRKEFIKRAKFLAMQLDRLDVKNHYVKGFE